VSVGELIGGVLVAASARASRGEVIDWFRSWCLRAIVLLERVCDCVGVGSELGAGLRRSETRDMATAFTGGGLAEVVTLEKPLSFRALPDHYTLLVSH
jgi:hypothetical protein